MSILSRTLLAAAIAATGFAVPASAMSPQSTVSALTRGVNAPQEGHYRADGRYGADGVAITLAQPDFNARPADAETMAREFLAARQGQLGLTAAGSDALARTSLRAGKHFSVVRFAQHWQGLPVYGSDIAVSVQPNGKIVYAANSAVTGLAPIANVVRKTAPDALAIARQYLGVADLQHQKTERMVHVADGATRIVWRVEAVPASGSSLRGDWELLVDADSGDVLRAENREVYADGTGTIWTPDPLSYKKVAYGATGYVDGNNADTQQLTDALVSVTLPNITQNGANYVLSGPYAVCDDWDAPRDAGCPSQPSTDFSVTRSAMTFDAVMGYYHISAYLKYLNETLGIAAMPINHPGGVHYDPHGFNGDDNSSFTPSTEKLTFGQGGVDDAQDADVLIHELGHGIHHFITGGHLSQVEGLSEGFGDYTGGAWSRDYPNQWTPSDAAYNWIYSWDGHNPFWAGRVLNYQLTRTYAQARSQEIHIAGQYWSSCNLVARGLLGGQVFDKAYFSGLSMTGGSTNQKDAAQAVINAAASLGYSQAQIDQIGVAYNSGNTGGNTGCTYAVTVPSVGGSPVADVDTTPLAASAETGASANATLAIGNTGSADLTWTVDTADAAACATPATTPWISFAPTGGTVASGAADASVAITLDASGLAVGSYSTNVCVHSNDSAHAVIAVPLTFTVTEVDRIFSDGFEGEATGTCEPQQLFADPSFEATDASTSMNPNWTVDESIAGSPLCDAGCDQNATIVARTGSWFVWFGGYTQENTASVSQSVTFPSGQPRWLNYWMINQIAGDPAATLKISIDGSNVTTVTPSSSESDYTVHSLEIPATYLDGQAHAVKFDWSSPAANAENASAIIDDVTLDCAATPPPTAAPARPGKALLKRMR
jgi:hypothetical protein